MPRGFFFVIPAKAGIYNPIAGSMDSRLRGNDRIRNE